jgi:V/A-type H+-transporting ATPase subunit C
MSPSGVSEYAAVHAQVRALYSNVLSREKWKALNDTREFSGIINILNDTVYGPYIGSVNSELLTPRRIAYEIKKHLATVYGTVASHLPEHTKNLVNQLFRLYEIDNIKAVIRGVALDESWDKILHTLFPLPESNNLPLQAMARSKNVESAIEQLRKTQYYWPLSHALERYKAEQTLFPLEVALDLDYWRKLWADISRLSMTERNHILRIIGTALDGNNLIWALRYRLYHNLSEEEIINYTLPMGYRVKDNDIRQIAAGANPIAILSRIYPDIAKNNILLGNLTKNLPDLELYFKKQTLHACQSAFYGYPFHGGIAIAYLLMVEMEIKDLIVIIEAKSMKIPYDRYQKYLIFDSQTDDSLN